MAKDNYMTRKHRVKQISRNYGYTDFKSSDVLKLMELFNAKNYYVEIIDIKVDSPFCKDIQSKKIKYVPSICFPSDEYVDIIISELYEESLTDVLDEAVSSNPGILKFHITDLPFEQFLYSSFDKHFTFSQEISKRLTTCVFEILFDENSFAVTYNAEAHSHPGLLSKIDHVFTM